ncbi:MAG: regulatory protein RecX [Deltaproteobacteria bacterium]|nr:regulatory protein RecX [Deltaproteobacteria bacterium]
MPKYPEKETPYAKTIALKYLSRAPKSTRDVELKLKEKGFAEDVIKETAGYLTDYGYLNDRMFAKNWAASRIKLRHWGENRITHGLRQNGVSEEIIKQVVDIAAADELDTAKIALEKWLKNKRQEKLKEKLKQKAFRHLQTKGFPLSIIISVTKKYLGDLEVSEL